MKDKKKRGKKCEAKGRNMVGSGRGWGGRNGAYPNGTHGREGR